METLTITIVVVSLGAAVVSVATRLYKIATATSFRVTNPRTGQSILVSSPADVKKLLELVD